MASQHDVSTRQKKEPQLRCSEVRLFMFVTLVVLVTLSNQPTTVTFSAQGPLGPCPS